MNTRAKGGPRYYQKNVGYPGVVYALENPAFRPGVHKIGSTRRSGAIRADEMNRRSLAGTPAAFHCVFECETLDCGLAEERVFRLLDQTRVGKAGQEFFDMALDSVREIITSVCREVDEEQNSPSPEPQPVPERFVELKSESKPESKPAPPPFIPLGPFHRPKDLWGPQLSSLSNSDTSVFPPLKSSASLAPVVKTMLVFALCVPGLWVWSVWPGLRHFAMKAQSQSTVLTSRASLLQEGARGRESSQETRQHEGLQDLKEPQTSSRLDWSRFSLDDRKAMDEVCSRSEFRHGPVAYRTCLTQLAAARAQDAPHHLKPIVQGAP